MTTLLANIIPGGLLVAGAVAIMLASREARRWRRDR